MIEEPFPFTRQMYEDWLREQDPNAPVCDLSVGEDPSLHCPIAYFINHDGLGMDGAVAGLGGVEAHEISTDSRHRWSNPPWVRTFIDAFDRVRFEKDWYEMRAGRIFYPLRYHDFTAAEVLAILEKVPKEDIATGGNNGEAEGEGRVHSEWRSKISLP